MTHTPPPFASRVDPPVMVRSRRDVLLGALRLVIPALVLAGVVAFSLIKAAGTILLVTAAILTGVAIVASRTPRATLLLAGKELREARFHGWMEIESEDREWTMTLGEISQQVHGRRRGVVVIVPLDLRSRDSAPGTTELRARSDGGASVVFSFQVRVRR